VLAEVGRILGGKFKLPPAKLRTVLIELEGSVETVQGAPELAWQLPDPDDAHLFDAAVFIGADCIVTGDKALWTVQVPGIRLKVISPRIFLESYT
jgi:predicted nucleic acid-binding protein